MSNTTVAVLEKTIAELEKRIQELKALTRGESEQDFAEELRELERQVYQLREAAFMDLDPWERTLLARHPLRPFMLDYVNRIFTEFTELHGDRQFMDDPPMVTGLARLNGKACVVIGQQKGRNTRENLLRNFGMARPEGYRKALRIMQLAERFHRPIFCFIDTPGAYPGIDAEARGQAEAIARNIMEMSRLRVPVIVTVIGEGGSGGALAIGVGNRVLMLENALYSVISPESCAAILWRDQAKGPMAARALRYGAQDCLQLGIADELISEPPGGAHHDVEGVAERLKEALCRHLASLEGLSGDALMLDRYERFRRLGAYTELEASTEPAVRPKERSKGAS